MRKIIGLIFLLVLLFGCQQQSATIKTAKGDVEVTTNVREVHEWCQAGSEWSMAGQQAVANMVIVGLVSSGKYAGYCHVTYDVDTAQGQANADFYFKEDGSGYQVVNVNGQTIETSWTAPPKE
ncbi:hypothetical protein JW707_02375 [Candidatus Woesearchaeota archaeon]|nr:hypothetical protein [Candidatus Woesearchaeota archaeon]